MMNLIQGKKPFPKNRYQQKLKAKLKKEKYNANVCINSFYI